MTQEQIDLINENSPMDWQTNEQGIFFQPYGVPDNIKGHVVYMRFEIGGVSGGTCWDTSDPTPYSNDQQPEFVALDLAIKEINPNVSYLKYKEIEEIISINYETDYEYYGNYTDFEIRYILLSQLEQILNS